MTATLLVPPQLTVADGLAVTVADVGGLQVGDPLQLAKRMLPSGTRPDCPHCRAWMHAHEKDRPLMAVRWVATVTDLLPILADEDASPLKGPYLRYWEVRHPELTFMRFRDHLDLYRWNADAMTETDRWTRDGWLSKFPQDWSPGRTAIICGTPTRIEPPITDMACPCVPDGSRHVLWCAEECTGRVPLRLEPDRIENLT